MVAYAGPPRTVVRIGQTGTIVRMKAPEFSNRSPAESDIVTDTVSGNPGSRGSLGRSENKDASQQILKPEPSFSWVQGAAERHAGSVTIRMSVDGGLPPGRDPTETATSGSAWFKGN